MPVHVLKKIAAYKLGFLGSANLKEARYLVKVYRYEIFTADKFVIARRYGNKISPSDSQGITAISFIL